MEVAILLTLSRDQNRKNTYLQDLVYVLHLKTIQVNYIIYKRNAYWTFTDIILHFKGCNIDFCNSEVMTSLPHNLALDLQPRFGFKQLDFLNLYNFLIN